MTGPQHPSTYRLAPHEMWPLRCGRSPGPGPACVDAEKFNRTKTQTIYPNCIHESEPKPQFAKIWSKVPSFACKWMHCNRTPHIPNSRNRDQQYETTYCTDNTKKRNSNLPLSICYPLNNGISRFTDRFSVLHSGRRFDPSATDSVWFKLAQIWEKIASHSGCSGARMGVGVLRGREAT